jgi:HEAT repeat protein
MRLLLVVGILSVFLGGCRRAEPTLVGGKPVNYWVQALQDPDAKLRKKAAFKLGNVGAADPAVVPTLILAVKDRDAGVRAEAILALLKIGPAVPEAIPAFLEAQKDRDANVRSSAAKALEKIQGDRK